MHVHVFLCQVYYISCKHIAHVGNTVYALIASIILTIYIRYRKVTCNTSILVIYHNRYRMIPPFLKACVLYGICNHKKNTQTTIRKYSNHIRYVYVNDGIQYVLTCYGMKYNCKIFPGIIKPTYTFPVMRPGTLLPQQKIKNKT